VSDLGCSGVLNTFLDDYGADKQGVPRETIKSFNCLADQELREGIKEYRYAVIYVSMDKLMSVTGPQSLSCTSRVNSLEVVISFFPVSSPLSLPIFPDEQCTRVEN
jgi:hypothetical protein